MQQTSSYEISSDQKLIIKGIAIILMLLHHLSFSKFAVERAGYCDGELVSILYDFCRICVPIFAFITGWSLGNKKLKVFSTIKKIFLFLVSYWVVTVPLIIVFVGLGGY